MTLTSGFPGDCKKYSKSFVNLTEKLLCEDAFFGNLALEDYFWVLGSKKQLKDL